MADTNANAAGTPAANSRDAARGAGESARGAAESARGAARDTARETTRTIGAEQRSFEDTTAATREVANAGFQAARDIGRQSAETTRQLAESSRRVGGELLETWRHAFGPLMAAQLETTRFFDQAWRQMTGLGALYGMMPARPFATTPAPLFGAPLADVRETSEAYEIAVEAPGVPREDLDVRLDGEVLTICGRKAVAREETSAAYRLSERRFGRFERSFPIPPDARREGIEAAHRDGVLTITLPKRDESRARPESRVEIR